MLPHVNYNMAYMLYALTNKKKDENSEINDGGHG